MREVVMLAVPYFKGKSGLPQNGCTYRPYQLQRRSSRCFRKVERSTGQIAKTQTMHVLPGRNRMSVQRTHFSCWRSARFLVGSAQAYGEKGNTPVRFSSRCDSQIYRLSNKLFRQDLSGLLNDTKVFMANWLLNRDKVELFAHVCKRCSLRTSPWFSHHHDFHAHATRFRLLRDSEM